MPVGMIGTALAVGGLTLAVGLGAVALLRLLPSLRLQLAGLAALAVCLPLASVLLSGWVAFHMGDDVKILAVSAASATVAVLAALLLARSIVLSVERVRDASSKLAAGDLSVRAPESGPSEVSELATSFNEMAAGLERLFDARRELVAWASHDLRTPLANMQAMLEALEDGLVTPDATVPVLREQVAALSALVDDLFELARIDAGALTLELRSAPLEPVVVSCLRGLEADARLRGIDLAATVPGTVTARCAPEKIERVLFNLLTNALRHTPSDGSVAVRVEQVDAEVQVSVEDTGDGLGEEARTRMFDRFWRGDPARSARGSGLGLAIARALVEAHGGRIWAEDRPEGGARVSFTLPAGAEAPPALAEALARGS
jgi:signal transduction histidine kinase